MQKFSPIKRRILNYLDSKGITKYEFYKNSGITRGTLDNPSGISESNIIKFLQYERNISLSWLITGEGEMLQKDQSGKPPPATRADDECKQEVEFYKRLLEKKEAELKQAYMDMGKLQANCKVKKESPYSDRTESFSKLTNKGEKTNEKSQS